jgi:hypothetical protein
MVFLQSGPISQPSRLDYNAAWLSVNADVDAGATGAEGVTSWSKRTSLTRRIVDRCSADMLPFPKLVTTTRGNRQHGAAVSVLLAMADQPSIVGVARC